MRAFAVLVVMCGCRVAASDNTDATTPRGDGLPERVVTDAALWADMMAAETRAVDARSDSATDLGNSDLKADVGSTPDSAPTPVCSLLQPTGCVGREGCYPLPFEGTPNGETQCAIEGIFPATAFCQSQLDCDGTTLCTAPGLEHAMCARRCATIDGPCPTGMRCVPFNGYPGVGVCLWM